MLNIGIRLHDTIPGTLREKLRYTGTQGFRCAHIALSKVLPDFRMDLAEQLMTDELAEEIRTALAEAEMSCAVLGCYLNLADPDPERREKTEAIYRAHLRFAGKINAVTVGTETPPAPGAPFSDPAGSEEAFRLFVDCLRPVVRCAEEENVTVAVEPVYRHIISTPERAERLLDEIPSDRLRIILDAVNLIAPERAGEADGIIAEAIQRLGDRVSVLHMKDYILENGQCRASACGTGNMRYGRLLSLAAERNLPMTLENTTPENAEQARLFLEQSYRRLKGAENEK